MSDKKDFSIRRMPKDDMSLAVEWARLEGWNPGIHDASYFFHTDERGFFIGELNGEPIGCISCVAYDDTFGFLGFYMVRPQYRGQGYGIQLWNEALKYMGNRNVGLDGVVDQQPNYKKSGFKLAYRNIRYEGESSGQNINCPWIVDITAVPIKQILSYDSMFFPVPRHPFIKRWIDQKAGKSLAYVKEGQVKGFGTIRKCYEGYKIGPLFADNKQIAENLLSALTGDLDRKIYYLDIPEVNEDAVRLVEEMNMKKVFETARMYTGEFYDLPFKKLFGVTTFELG